MIRHLPVGDIGTNCYIVSGGTPGTCLIVDPGDEAGAVAAALGDLRPEAVLLTHGHWDHTGAADALCEACGVPLYIHPLDAPMLKDPYLNASEAFGRSAVCHTEPLPLNEGPLELAGLKLNVLHTPGHTPGSVCLILPGETDILTGDTLFQGGYGRTDLPGGDFHALRESLRRLMMTLPRMTAWPGHGPRGTAGRENPIF